MTDVVPSSRRRFLRGTALAGAGVALGGPFQALAATGATAAPHQTGRVGYGPLQPVNDQATGLPLLLLPRGFSYVSFGWFLDQMSDGVLTPAAHDGMATFEGQGRRNRSRVHLVRNHEQSEGSAFSINAYDPRASGGTTNLVFDTRAGALVEDYASLSGTIRNCAGGPTPWQTWLTCEETTVSVGDDDLTQNHGYVFEVPADGPGNPDPLVGLGRFSHEAAAVDNRTGFVYITEDEGSSGLYRFRPSRFGDLASGGPLEMLKIGQRAYDTSADPTNTFYPQTSWVPVPDPDPDLAGGAARTYDQGLVQGGATFSRGEGAWFDRGRLYFISTDGGPIGKGQVFEYDPRRGSLRLVYASTNANRLDNPDNICVSPDGALVLCEDGPGEQFVRGLTTDGRIFDFAKNNVVLSGERNGISGDFREVEFAGATFSPDGNWLFVNIQTPGITFAITGDFERGAL